MNQKEIGKYIAQKRKEKNLTQSQLAEKLGVASKTISKWETGVSMPDYSVIEALCTELSTTPSQLIAGADEETKTINSDDKRILFLLKRLQELNTQNKMMLSLLLITLAAALLGISLSLSGSAIKEFVSGVFTGFSIILSCVGIFSFGKAFKRRK